MKAIQNNKDLLVLGEPNSGRTISIIASILQKILDNPTHKNNNKKDNDDLFLNTEKLFEDNKKNILKNKDKRYSAPRGALVLSPRFEFTTKLYSIFRKLDSNNKIRMTRLGSSLQSICPMIEHIENKDYSDSDYCSRILSIFYELMQVFRRTDIVCKFRKTAFPLNNNQIMSIFLIFATNKLTL